MKLIAPILNASARFNYLLNPFATRSCGEHYVYSITHKNSNLDNAIIPVFVCVLVIYELR